MLRNDIKAMDLDKIRIEGGFWGHYIRIVREQAIPYQWEALNDRLGEDAAPSGCLRNFRIAAGVEEGAYEGPTHRDSDLYKWLEAVAYTLWAHQDEALMEKADAAIDLIEKAQQPDGYLATYHIVKEPEKKFANLMYHHELYDMGHMVEAAVAYYRATGKRRFLDVAARFVDCAMACFGPEEGKRKGYPGHEVAEMALAALYDVTGEEKYLQFAKYFIDQRGQEPGYFVKEAAGRGDGDPRESFLGLKYFQADRPVREQQEAQGHAVRAAYLYCGMADVAGRTGDEGLFDACRRLWENIVNRRMYVTGSIGSGAYGEAFTFDYDLPNDRAYNETCAAIGLVFFARRMFERTGESAYVDVMERALYNGVLSGISLDGRRFFYVNPLEVVPEACEKDHSKNHVKPERQKWFGCACCPPNVLRLVSSIGGYAYEQTEDTLYINLFLNGGIHTAFHGKKVRLWVETSYPWEGDIIIKVLNEEPAEFNLAVRIPGWCRDYGVTVNGKREKPPVRKGFLVIAGEFQKGDEICLELEMPVCLIGADPRVREDIGKAAVQRGPLVYCLEEADNGDFLQHLVIDSHTEFKTQYEKALLGGVVTVKASGLRMAAETVKEGEEERPLYRDYEPPQYRERPLKLIPYYAWANREQGEMAVWIRAI